MSNAQSATMRAIAVTFAVLGVIATFLAIDEIMDPTYGSAPAVVYLSTIAMAAVPYFIVAAVLWVGSVFSER